MGNDNAAGVVKQYTLPVSNSSVSNFSFGSTNVVSVAEDASGNVAVGALSGQIQFYTAPVSGGSVPSALFQNGAASNNGQIAFTPTGDFFAATVGNRVNFFTHPFSNASVPASFVTDPAMVSAIGVALDSAQNLYVANAGVGTAITCSSGAGSCSNILIFAPPYTGAPIVTANRPSAAYRKMSVTATQAFVNNVAGANGGVDIYNLPLTGASTPVATITNGIATPEGSAVDATGKLYIGNLSNATVTVYSAPFSAASVPVTSLLVSAGAFAIFGIAIGPASTNPGAIPAIGDYGLLALFAVLSLAGFLVIRTRS